VSQAVSLNRQIVRLALPALGALMAEPAFLIVDSILVGHLGVVPLAGLGIAAAVLQTIVGLMIFLAYSTTPAVARRFGEGNKSAAVSVGIDGMWLALGLGAVLAVAGFLASPWLVSLFGAGDAVASQATIYLSISMWGLPAMLIVYAATGLLRGMQDTVTPLWIVGFGFAANAGLNALFIYGFGWGIAGSAIGTVTAQWAMVVAFVLVVARLAGRHGATTKVSRSGLRGSARSGGWMFLRTLSLRIALLLTVVVATGMGAAELAGWQIVFTIFSAAAFALDALAIAAQALIGKGLGEGDRDAVRQIMRHTTVWGIWFGVLVGGAIAALSGVLGLIFTGDAEISGLIVGALLVLAVIQPIAAIIFVYDGVLMGAGDVRYLAIAGGLNLLPTLPALWAVAASGIVGSPGLVNLALAYFGVYFVARLVTLGLRILSGRWMDAEV
jgi:putative MATE family efflux protein